MSTIWEETILVYSGCFGYMAKLNMFWQFQYFHFCAQNKLFLKLDLVVWSQAHDVVVAFGQLDLVLVIFVSGCGAI